MIARVAAKLQFRQHLALPLSQGSAIAALRAMGFAWKLMITARRCELVKLLHPARIPRRRVLPETANLVKEEDLVRNAEDDFMTPANAFETHVGHFWGIYSTRDYMRARYAVADYVRSVGTLDGVREACEHLRDMLRLCRSDNMGVRDHLPALMLQLDMDQECYDLIKWYSTSGQDEHYDWGDMELPFLDICGADVTEDVTMFEHRFADLGHVTSILLLKLKLLVDLGNVKKNRKVIAKRLPPELRSPIEQSVVRSPLSMPMLGKSNEELDKLEQKLIRQVTLLGHATRMANEYFFEALLDPECKLDLRPQMYTYGSREAVLLTLGYAFAAWRAHEGVLELLHAAKAFGAHSAEEEEMRLLDLLTDKDGDRMRPEMFTLGEERLWAYISCAFVRATETSEELNDDELIDAADQAYLRDFPTENHHGQWYLEGPDEEDSEFYDDDRVTEKVVTEAPPDRWPGWPGDGSSTQRGWGLRETEYEF